MGRKFRSREAMERAHEQFYADTQPTVDKEVMQRIAADPWWEISFLPRTKYRVEETPEGWRILTQDDGSFS